MIISHTCKFICLNPPKTGSGWRERVFLPYSDFSVVTVKKSGLPEPEGNYRHCNYSLSKEFLMKDDWDILEYFVFTFVRNPWERAVSWANMNFVQGNSEINGLLLRNAVAQTLSPQYKQTSYYTKPLKQGHQTTRTVDYIGSLENHETDLREVSALLGLKLDLEPPTFRRKSYHKEISKFWDSELSGRIEEGEAETIAMMGYKNPY
jgi:hypothetical protein